MLKKFVLLCAGLLCFHSAAAQGIDYVDARFSVEYNHQPTQGQNLLKIQRDGDHYQVDFALDHWLLASEQHASFEMESCDVTPVSYVASNKRPFKGETTQTLEFDWQEKKAEYRSDGEQKSFDLNEHLYDPVSLFFEARCELMAGNNEFSYPLIRNGRKTTHTYKVVRTETVETGQGPVEALVVERQRSSSKRHTRFYVAPALDYLLVKIEHQEGRLLNVVATLSQMDYALVPRE